MTTTTVVWSSIATASPMGQQRYEIEIQKAMRALDSPQWEFVVATVGSLRSPVQADRRHPTRVTNRLPLFAARAVGAKTYGRHAFVHRFDLRLPPAFGREVVTVHDLPPLRFADEGSLPRFSVGSARRARAIICPSTFAAQEIEELVGRVAPIVIPYGLAESFSNPRALWDTELGVFGVRAPFVIHAAGATQRKNLKGLADAWREISNEFKELQLVLCGPEDHRRTELFAGLERVVLTGAVPADDIARLMASASAVVVPSTYEGFGLPALEGMACGTPVVAADRGALPEVCGDAGMLVEPTGEALADGLRRVLTDDDFASRLRVKGRRRAKDFDWVQAAEAHLDVYRQAFET